MPEPITITAAAIGIGTWFGQWAGGKILDSAWQKFKDSQVVKRAIDKTNQTFTGSDHRWSSGSIRPHLKDWTQSSRFKGSLRKFSEEAQVDEDELVEQFLEVTNYPEDVERSSAREIVREFLQNLNDELNETDEGERLARRIEGLHAERKKENEGILEGVSNNQESLDKLHEKVDRLEDEGVDLEEPFKNFLREGLDQVQEAIDRDKLPHALGLLEKRLERLSDFEDQHSEAQEIIREHRQHVYIVKTSVLSWMGKTSQAREAWKNAKAVGLSFDSYRLVPAATAAFNAGETEDLRVIVGRLGPAHKEYEKFQALIAFEEEEWEQVIEILPEDAEDDDLRLLRAQALIQELTEERVIEAYSHLTHVAGQASSPFLLRLLANAGFLLLRGLLRNRFDPPEFDREEFVFKVRKWVNSAVEAYREKETSASGYVRSLMLGINVFDFLDEREAVFEFRNELRDFDQGEIEGRMVLQQDLTPDELADLEEKDKITTAERLYHEAIHFESDESEDRAIAKLRAALEVTGDQDERELIAQKLISLLVRIGDLDGAESILERVNDLSSELRQILEVPLISEKHGEEQALEFMMEAASKIAGSSLILSNLTKNLIENAYRLQSGQSTDDKVLAQEYTSKALEYAEELVRVLPSPESFRQLADAYRLNGNVGSAIDFIDMLRERGYFPLHVRHLIAQCYLDQNNVLRAARTATEAVSDYPNNWELRNKAAALWGRYGDPAQAIDLLEPVRDGETASIAPYVNLARSYLRRGNEEKDDYEEAVEVLEAAHKEAPENRRIITMLYRASRCAGMHRKSGLYLRELTSDASRTEVETPEDVEGVLENEEETVLHGDAESMVEGVAEHMRRDREGTEAANRLISNSVLAYGDRFLFTGRAWANWTGWVHFFEERWKEGDPSRPAIHAGWPTALDVAREEAMRIEDDGGVLLDKTALLTLGILQTEGNLIRDLINAGVEVYLCPGTMEWLHEEVLDLEDQKLWSCGRPYREVKEVIQRFELAKPVTTETLDEVDLPPEVKEVTGAEVFDVEKVYQSSGYYVTDIEDLNTALPDTGVTSRQLLRALNELGIIEASIIEEVARERPDLFDNWKDAELIGLSPDDTIVFGQFALVDWFELGLHEHFGNFDSQKGPELKIGPWAFQQVRKEAKKVEVFGRAENEAVNIRRSLFDLIYEHDLREINEDIIYGEKITKLDDRVRPVWSHTIDVLSTASENELHVWADDRFLSLVLKPYGLFIGDQTLQGEAQKLHDAFEEVGILSTEQLLIHLSKTQSEEGLRTDPKKLGWNLIESGYRPLLMRLGLRHLLREYPYHAENPALPYQELFRVLDSIHDWAPEDAHPKRKQDFSRLLASTIYPGLILEAWCGSGNEDVQVEECRSLATEFLDKFEESIRHESDQFDEFIGVLWRSVQEKLARSEELDFEEKRTALSWLGDQALVSGRDGHRSTIVRALEDDLLQAVSFVWTGAESWAHEAPTAIDETDLPPEFAIQFALPRIIPLIETDLIDEFDPLIRRVVGFVAEQEEEGLISYILEDEEGDEEEVQESEFEESAHGT